MDDLRQTVRAVIDAMRVYADSGMKEQNWRYRLWADHLDAALAQQVPADGDGYRLAWEHLAANSYDHHTPYMVCIPTDEWKAAEAMLAATPQAPQPVVDATIGQQAVDVAAHEALTLLEQATCHDGRYGQMERIGWQESAQKLLPRLRAALAAHGKPNAGIHRAAEGRPVE